MKIIPEVKCRRCGESFSALRSTCPACGTRRVAQSSRTPAATPSKNAGTAAYERANVNAKWQLIFGLILVAAVILAVIVMVSTGLNDENYGTEKEKDTKEKTDTVETQAPEETAPTQPPAPTPAPTPTPQVQSIEIRYRWDDKKRDDISVSVGDETPLYAYYTPTDIQGAKVVWTVDDAGKDCFVFTEDTENKNHVVVKCVKSLPAGSGGVYIYATVFGQTAKCMVHVR
ncbi:MAG: hypothetical protein K6G17_07745 [Oscillospiraceae bacterium]|nr:hypothetical protein [Oscillospiraceae bacterium]